MTAGRRTALAAAVLAAPVAWAAQLVIGYSLEEGGCSAGDTKVASAGVDGVAFGVSVVTALVALAEGPSPSCSSGGATRRVTDVAPSTSSPAVRPWRPCSSSS